MKTTIERIKELMYEKDISALSMSRDLGFSNAVFSQWNTGKHKPSAEALYKIADYFNVSVDYLLGRSNIKTISSPKISELDANLYNAIATLDEASKVQLLSYIAFLNFSKNIEPPALTTEEMLSILRSIEEERDKEA